jgi:hypothetical protein
MTMVALQLVMMPLPGRIFAAREAKSLALSNDKTISAKVVNVLPSPMTSANIPPIKSLGNLLLAPVTTFW